MLRAVVLRVLPFVDMRLPVFSVAADLYCLKRALRYVDADQLIRYLRHNSII